MSSVTEGMELPPRGRKQKKRPNGVPDLKSHAESFYVMDVYGAYVDKNVRKRSRMKGREKVMQRQRTVTDEEIAIRAISVRRRKGSLNFARFSESSLYNMGNKLWKSLKEYGWWEKFSSVLFMALLGLVCSIFGFAINYCVSWIGSGRMYISTYYESKWIGWLIYTGTSLCLVSISAVCTLIVKQASGSGVSQLKSILGGIMLYRYLDLIVLVLKIVGLVAALGAGLSIGKEGPYIHIAAILAHQLCRIPMFSHIDRNALRKLSMLSCACAAGIASNFGTIIGGVIFSIEVTATSYFVSNLPKSFFVALVSAMFIKLLGTVQTAPDVYALMREAGQLPLSSNQFFQITTFFALGLFCGGLAALFVVSAGHIFSLSRRKVPFVRKQHYILLFVVVIMTCSATYPFAFLRSYDRQNISKLIQLVLTANWSAPSIFTGLSVFILVKFLLTIFSPSLPIPAGVFLPVFVIGAAVGRLFGEFLEMWFPGYLVVGSAATYAIVGAASLSGAVTGSMSTAIITFELVGDIQLLVPIVVSVMIAVGVSKLISPSIYDTISRLLNLPFLPSQPGASHGSVAADVMRQNLATISKTSTFSELEDCLERSETQLFFPVVTRGGGVIGAVERTKVERAVKNHQILFDHSRSEFQDEHDMHESDGADDDGGPSLFDDENSMDRSIALDGKAILSEEESRRAFFDLPNTLDFNDGRTMAIVPFQVLAHSPIEAVWTLFRMLGVEHIFVTSPGRLMGMITKRDLLTGQKIEDYRPIEQALPIVKKDEGVLLDALKREGVALDGERGDGELQPSEVEDGNTHVIVVPEEDDINNVDGAALDGRPGRGHAVIGEEDESDDDRVL